MKPKSYKTDPFKYTYKVYDKFAGVCAFVSTSLIDTYEVLDQYRDETVVVSQFNHYFYLYDSGHPMRSWESTVPRYELWDHFGKPVPYSRYYAAFNRLYPRYRHHNYRSGYWGVWGGKRDTTKVQYKKNDPNKIKRGYYHTYCWSDVDVPRSLNFKVDGYFRTISTTNERRQNALHVAEYGPNIIRGARRGRSLPDSWDDYCNSAGRAANNWKHNSKRRHQWKVK